MFATFRLTTKVFFKTFQGVFFAFAWPLLIMFILNAIFKTIPNDSNINYVNVICPGMIFISTFSVGLFGMTNTAMKLKESCILKRICVSPLSKMKFLMGLILFFFTMQIISSLWTFLWAYALYSGDGLKMPNGGWFLIGWIFSALLNIIISLLILGNIKTQENAYSLTILILIPTLFLSGVMFAIPDTGWISWVSEALPQRQVYDLFFQPWTNGSSAFHPSGSHSLDVLKWVSLPMVFMIAFFSLTVWLFKWE